MEEAILLYADTERSADQLYFGRVMVPDPFIALAIDGMKVAVVNALEFGRMSRESVFDSVLPLEDLRLEALKHFGKKYANPVGIVRILQKKFSITRFIVPYDFPAGMALALRKVGVNLVVADGLLFPERERKSDAEAKEIRRANGIVSKAFRRVEEILSAATIRSGRLYWEGKPLISERMHEEIAKICIENGATASGTIVAGGNQGCDPHCRGHGPLRQNELIVVDIFPRLNRTGYHGDMTRTYLKGTPSAEQVRLVETVRAAQRHALSRLGPGESGEKIYREVMEQFNAAGYQTQKKDGIHVGFFHGLGHGLGLDVHEPPRLSVGGPDLADGNVVTIEPGLYYPGLGGCRIEDVVRVSTENGCEMLSRHPYRWVI